ncbi:hypothetical protein Cfor_00135, partial [Coptotermes formosanus]
ETIRRFEFGFPPHYKKFNAGRARNFFRTRSCLVLETAWPPRSPDLSAFDFFLWGYLKQKVYVNRPNTIQGLKDNVRAHTARIPQATLWKVMHSVRQSVEFCLESGGAHLSDTIFKKVTI